MIDANDLETMAKARPDEMFLRGSGVLKLLAGIRQLETELREVRKQDEALIKQMLEALENHQGNYKLTEAECVPVDIAITAAHARLDCPHKRTTP